MVVLPPHRPQWPAARVAAVLAEAGVIAPVALLGVRGYYRDTMGEPGRNDFGIYDDAVFLLTPTASVSVNANTDPSRAGYNAKAGKPMAVLAPGTWQYRLGRHKGIPALVQAGSVTVLRGADPATGAKGKAETGWFGINIHPGGYGSTSSEGCQTIHPDQWAGFYAVIASEMRRYSVATLPYHLIEAQG